MSVRKFNPLMVLGNCSVNAGLVQRGSSCDGNIQQGETAFGFNGNTSLQRTNGLQQDESLQSTPFYITHNTQETTTDADESFSFYPFKITGTKLECCRCSAQVEIPESSDDETEANPTEEDPEEISYAGNETCNFFTEEED